MAVQSAALLATVSAAAAVAPPALAGDWYAVPPAGASPKTIFITGANSGIGFAAARKLAAAGHDVHLACRTMAKAETACAEITRLSAPLAGSVTPHECDLASMASIRTCASAVAASGLTLDVLCLNAGAQFVGLREPKRSADGFELTVGVNHLGHFLLANLLLPRVQASAQPHPRIVVTASEVHDPQSPGGKVGPGATLGDLSGLKAGPGFEMISGGPFEAEKAYKDSKLCNVLFARELSSRLAAAGSPVTVNAFGPGLITRSGFFRAADPKFIGIFDFVTNDVLHVAETVDGGGGCLAYVAVDPALEGRSGVYLNNDLDGIPGFCTHKFAAKEPSTEARNAAEGRELWRYSAALVGLDA